MKDKRQPKELERLFVQAVAHHQNREIDAACLLYENILEELPDSPLVNYNYGLALYEIDRLEESCRCYQKALSHAPEDTDILYNLALCLKKLGKYAETVTTYEKILIRTPDDIDALYNLGCCLKDMGRYKRAISIFQIVLKLSPVHKAAINNLAFLHHRNEDFPCAEKYYRDLLRLEPDNAAAQHMLCSIRGETSPSAPSGYIEKVFDHSSDHFDEVLVKKLEYIVPRLMREHFDATYGPLQRSLNTLDLGCGTGLGGEAFKDIVSTLHGVDISKKMIEKAREKSIYTTLTASEIHEFLEKESAEYDLILAADVLIYLGDVESVFSLMENISHSDTFFIFSTEKCSGGNYKLRKSGRFAHSQGYIDEICRKSGWNIVHRLETHLRKEGDAPISGIIYFTSRQQLSPFDKKH